MALAILCICVRGVLNCRLHALQIAIAGDPPSYLMISSPRFLSAESVSSFRSSVMATLEMAGQTLVCQGNSLNLGASGLVFTVTPLLWIAVGETSPLHS